MSKTSFLLDFGLLRSHAAFRTLFIARLVSVLSLGLLAVAIPIQVQALTESPLKVGLALSMAGIGMFVGLLTGGVLADRLERRRLILAARSICGLGFIGLAVNASLPEPSLNAIYLLALWDGFFGALGVTALLAVTPILVGRESMVQAGALNMLSVRVAAIVAPPLGTLLIAQSGVAWNYGLTACGTLITLLVLLRLPRLPPPEQPRETPWEALGGGIAFLFENRLLGAVALVGALVTMANAVRVLYPSLGESWGAGYRTPGLALCRRALGAAIGALTSGRLNQAPRPGAYPADDRGGHFSGGSGVRTVARLLAVRAVPGAVRLPGRAQCPGAVRADPAPDAGSPAGAHQCAVDGAEHRRRGHWRGAVRRPGQPDAAGAGGVRLRPGRHWCGRPLLDAGPRSA